ncbi:YhcG family protein [Rhabdochlamydiaceae symbiont of Dictyostelium giganteum]|uniref:PDDEXK nuclease domain-containing protein n=1 Tax=Rhabdochlamydiaceae symbiont of Dictyostelium giganteum TaxID=3342349 RepID=UPI00384ACD0F
MNSPKHEIIDSKSYAQLLDHIKKDIQESRLRATTSITQELTALYWRIGKMLLDKASIEGRGAKTIEHVAKDLNSSFPGVSGFSYRNLQYMKRFAEYYSEVNFATAVAQIPWGHNILLMEKVDSFEKRVWYAEQSIQHGWSRTMLTMWIESDLYNRQGKAVTNFKKTLPSPQSDLAIQMMKDPYNFSFLTLDKDHREKELEKGLTDHIQRFLLELGHGFAFVGRQVPLQVGGKDYYLDLLFYHFKLRRFIVCELKACEFEANDIGQINLYLSAVDTHLKQPKDKPSIGMIFCKTKDNLTVEYALRDFKKPISVSGYQVNIVDTLTKELKENLPTIEEIEAEFTDENFKGKEK